MAKILARAFIPTLAMLVLGFAFTASAVEPVQWDEEASKELTHALHQMHETWNAGDIASLKDMMIGDDVLVSFELDPATHAPIRLTSKAEIDKFVDNVVTEISAQEKTTHLEMPRLACRATENFGVCTEECTVHFKDSEGTITRTDKLWSTTVAVKGADGWKFIQWHMSTAQVPQDEVRTSALD